MGIPHLGHSSVPAENIALTPSPSSPIKSKEISVAEEVFNSEVFQTELKNIEFTALPLHVERLENGLTIYFLPHQDKTATGNYAALRGVVRVGFDHEECSRYKDLDLRQIAHFVEHCAYLCQGQESADAMRQTMNSWGCPLGADSNAATGTDYTYYDLLKVPLTNFESFKKATDIIHNLLFCATFPKEIMGERVPVTDEMSRKPVTYKLWDHHNKHVVPGTPRGIHNELSESIFKTDDYEKVREILMQFYKEFYRPDNIAIICVLGSYEKEALDYLRQVFSRPSLTDHPLWSEPIPQPTSHFKPSYDASEFLDHEVVSHSVTIYQNSSKKNRLIHNTPSTLDIKSKKFKKFVKEIIDNQIDGVIMFISLAVLAANEYEHLSQGVNRLVLTPTQIGSYTKGRSIKLTAAEGKVVSAYHYTLQFLQTMETELTESNVADCLAFMTNEMQKSDSPAPTNIDFIDKLFDHFTEGRLFTSSTEHTRLCVAALKALTVADIKRRYRESVLPVISEKRGVHQLIQGPAGALELTAEQAKEQLLKKMASEKPALQHAERATLDLFSGIDPTPSAPISKKSYDNGVIEYHFANGVRVVLNPNLTQKEIFAQAYFDAWPSLLDMESQRLDYIALDTALMRMKDAHYNGVPGTVFSLKALQKCLCLSSYQFNQEVLQFSVGLNNLDNKKELFQFMHLYSQPHLFCDTAQGMEELHELMLDDYIKIRARREQTSDFKFNRTYVQAVRGHSSFAFDVSELEIKQILSFKNFQDRVQFLLERLPAPTIVMSGYFEVAEVEPFLDKYIGSLSYPKRSRFTRPLETFPAGIIEKEFTCKGTEGRTRTTLSFPVPRIADLYSYNKFLVVQRILEHYVNDRMRFEGAQKVYSVAVSLEQAHQERYLTIPCLTFSFSYPTPQHEEMMAAFWTVFEGFKLLEPEEKEVRLETNRQQSIKYWNTEYKKLHESHQQLNRYIINGFPFEDAYSTSSLTSLFNQDVMTLAGSLLQRDNYVRVTMHTRENPEKRKRLK